MFEEVKAILAKQLRKDPSVITMESRIMADLGADSLSTMELLMNLEDKYNIFIEEDVLASFVTVGDVVNYLDKLGLK